MKIKEGVMKIVKAPGAYVGFVKNSFFAGRVATNTVLAKAGADAEDIKLGGGVLDVLGGIAITVGTLAVTAAVISVASIPAIAISAIALAAAAVAGGFGLGLLSAANAKFGADAQALAKNAKAGTITLAQTTRTVALKGKDTLLTQSKDLKARFQTAIQADKEAAKPAVAPAPAVKAEEPKV